jgi:two-component system, HptB-dependent secretion and biofilm response regulator
MNESMELKKSCILVVDDDEMINMLFCGFLESKGFETLSASGVAEAKKILQTVR